MKILAGNWKMHKTRAECRTFFDALRADDSGSAAASGAKIDPKKVRQIVAPSPTLLESAVTAAVGTGVEIFAQNCAWEKSGALTGETSPSQLKELGVTGTLVGHSERRQFFGESNESCEKRARTALNEGLQVIFCFGETLDERKASRTRAVLEEQLAPVLRLRASHDALVLAYEPVWAIGTGVTAEPEQVREAHAWIAEILDAAHLRHEILYGGSVKPANFAELARIPFVAGGLVGGASLEPASYIQLRSALMTL